MRMGPNTQITSEYTGQKVSFKKGFGKLLKYCKPYRIAIIIALICAVGGAIFSLLGPDKLGELTNEIQKGLGNVIDMDAIWSIAVILICFYATSFILSYAQQWIMASITQRLSKRLRRDISLKINRLPLKYLDRTSNGDILSRVTNDVDTLGQTLNQSVGALISSVVLFLGSIIAMFITNPILAAVAIGASLLGFAFMILMITRSQKYFIAQQEQLGALNGHIEETYTGHNVVLAYGAQDSLRNDFIKTNDKLYKSAYKSQFVSGIMMPMMMFVGNFGYVAVCVVGAVLAANGTIGWGIVAAFIAYVRMFTQPLSQIAQTATSLQSASAASGRVFEFLEQTELEDESQKIKQLLSVRGDVEFKNVKFGYLPDKTIINNFSACVQAGQKVAIVGPTGAGKTTVVNLLMRFYELDGGQITIDGTPISELTRENIHALFGMVLQDTWLFNGTVRENLVYGRPDATDEEVITICKGIGIDHFIRTLPQGYNTELTDTDNISAGQKQLITIARAMIENAPMLILDEATSSVDTRTEIQIQNAMEQLTKSRTSFVIAHRLSTIKNSDLILVMKNGDIIESGKHEELIKNNGFYAELYNSQFARAV